MRHWFAGAAWAQRPAALGGEQGTRVCRRRGPVLRGDTRSRHYRRAHDLAAIPPFAYEDRTICEIRSSHQPEEVFAWFPDRVIYVGGGPPVWDVYAPYIRHWDIT